MWIERSAIHCQMPPFPLLHLGRLMCGHVWSHCGHLDFLIWLMVAPTSCGKATHWDNNEEWPNLPSSGLPHWEHGPWTASMTFCLIWLDWIQEPAQQFIYVCSLPVRTKKYFDFSDWESEITTPCSLKFIPFKSLSSLSYLLFGAGVSKNLCWWLQ